MEQIKILFFALLSFFNIENGRIAANKTTVTIDTIKKTVHIQQEKLFTIVETDTDATTVIDQWSLFLSLINKGNLWSKELQSYPMKEIKIHDKDSIINPLITLKYSNPDDLRKLGIWYNESRNDYSINNVPSQNLKTHDGKLKVNYWVFKGDTTFTFTLEPYLHLPEQYQSLIKPLEELLSEAKK
ncbi:hypothetical protein BST92_13160 [Nonlabens arenilitoris]|uniref:Uncharacterized protein n=1 Tax=Nonlabens arenilitoris TaxID=1217969 RepID=A0A2S7UD46_9FLAO|nr:hypothetical protein [Nonlabens arenilitoris]PQJ32809.1 hypothetical protein BST92_13160 [Nonlabens arenilitoris]